MIISEYKLKTLENIRIEHNKLVLVYRSMLGNLYPSMAYTEICELRELWKEKAGKDILEGEWLSCKPPNTQGYVQ